MKMYAAHQSAPSGKTSDQNLDLIRWYVRLIAWIHVVVLASVVVASLVARSQVYGYANSLASVVPPEKTAEAVQVALETLSYVHNITDDLTFIVHQLRSISETLGGSGGFLAPATAVSRRSALEEQQPEAMVAATERFQESASRLMDSLRVKVDDVDARVPGDLIRWLMALNWRADIATRFDRTLEGVRYAELVTGTVLAALSTSSANFTRLLDS